MRITTAYDEVSLTHTKQGKCPACGKIASRTKKFYQTMNPFNLTKEGFIKSREDIIKELSKQINIWEKEPVYHSKCEK